MADLFAQTCAHRYMAHPQYMHARPKVFAEERAKERETCMKKHGLAETE